MADEPFIGPKIPQSSTNRLASKLNHFFTLKSSKGLSLNHQLAAHPDFHAPGITEGLLQVIGLDPWSSNLPSDVINPSWEESAEFKSNPFDYLKVAQEQRLKWESKNPQIMNATAKTSGPPPSTTTTSFSMPRKRI